MEKIFGTILIIFGLISLVYSFFIPLDVSSAIGTDKKIEALSNKNIMTYGLIFLIAGILMRKELFELE